MKYGELQLSEMKVLVTETAWDAAAVTSVETVEDRQFKTPIKESALTNRCSHQLESLTEMESTDGMSELLMWKFSIIILRAV